MSVDAWGDVLIFFLPLLSAGLTFAFAAFGIYYSNRYQGNRLIQALAILNQVVIEIVKELNQTVVDDLKAAKADGKLTSDEAIQIKNKAIDLILTRLGLGSTKILQRAFGSIWYLISTKIEAVIYDLKKESKKRVDYSGQLSEE